MKNKLTLAIVGVLVCGLLTLIGCGSDIQGTADADSGQTNSTATGSISVYSREDGSGTRGAFVELFGIEEKDDSGEKVDMTTLSAVITNSTSVMMTSVASDENAIGYLSLGSLDDSVKALAIDGTEPTVANVKDGSYKIARPFNIAHTSEVSDTTQDFIDYILSSDGQNVVEESGYIATDDSAEPYEASAVSGKIVIAGSSSVTPVMEKLKEAYEKLNPDVTIEIQQSDSTTGMNMATEGTCDIGMASRELKDSEISAGLEATVIAQDGIAVIANKNLSLDALSSEQVKDIYVGSLSSWSEVA